MKTVSVLMSTYNGEKYLKEQIESVLSQVGVKVNLIVRDDGSTDTTREILLKYQKQGKLDVCFANNIGWRMSFMELVYNAPRTDYYAFCDQDDIWLPEKLSVAVSQIEAQSDLSIPILYGSNLFYYSKGKNEGMLRLNPNFTKQTSLLRAMTCGCTLVFNDALCSLLKDYRPKFVEAHDTWIFMTAIYFGKVIFDPNAHILYRQHDNNQVGAKNSFVDRISRGIKTLKRLGKEQNKRKSAEEFLRVYDNILSTTDKEIISKFSNYDKDFLSHLRLLFDNRYSLGNSLSDFFLKLKILTNTI